MVYHNDLAVAIDFTHKRSLLIPASAALLMSTPYRANVRSKRRVLCRGEGQLVRVCRRRFREAVVATASGPLTG